MASNPDGFGPEEIEGFLQDLGVGPSDPRRRGQYETLHQYELLHHDRHRLQKKLQGYVDDTPHFSLPRYLPETGLELELYDSICVSFDNLKYLQLYIRSGLQNRAFDHYELRRLVDDFQKLIDGIQINITSENARHMTRERREEIVNYIGRFGVDHAVAEVKRDANYLRNFLVGLGALIFSPWGYIYSRSLSYHQQQHQQQQYHEQQQHQAQQQQHQAQQQQHHQQSQSHQEHQHQVQSQHQEEDEQQKPQQRESWVEQIDHEQEEQEQEENGHMATSRNYPEDVNLVKLKKERYRQMGKFLDSSDDHLLPGYDPDTGLELESYNSICRVLKRLKCLLQQIESGLENGTPLDQVDLHNLLREFQRLLNLVKNESISFEDAPNMTSRRRTALLNVIDAFTIELAKKTVGRNKQNLRNYLIDLGVMLFLPQS